MEDSTDLLDSQSHSNWSNVDDGPSLTTRIAFASAWVIIAVAGIIGESFSLDGALLVIVFFFKAILLSFTLLCDSKS
jgi:hypothetical protein